MARLGSQTPNSGFVLPSAVQSFVGPIIFSLGFLLIIGLFSLLSGIIMTIAGFSFFDANEHHPTQVAGPVCLVLGLLVTLGSVIGLSTIKSRARSLTADLEMNHIQVPMAPALTTITQSSTTPRYGNSLVSLATMQTGEMNSFESIQVNKINLQSCDSAPPAYEDLKY